jgi:hypothetical protein
MFTVGQEVFVTQLGSAHGIIDPEGERGVISAADRIDNGQQLVYVQWVERPMINQRNAKIIPYAQMWLTPGVE